MMAYNQTAPLESSSLQNLANPTDPSRIRKESSSSILTSDTTTTTGFTAPIKSSIGSGLSARRTPSGIPFFSRKSSGNGNPPINLPDKSTTNLTDSTISQDSSTVGSKNKSVKSPDKTAHDGEIPGRKSMMALNVFIRNSVTRRPTLSSAKISPSSHSTSPNETAAAVPTSKSSSSRHSLKSLPAKTSPVKETHAISQTAPKKLSISLLNGINHNQNNNHDSLDPHLDEAASPKKSTLGSKASNLIGRRRGKVSSLYIYIFLFIRYFERQ
jgi:hypothetical protein